MRTHMVIKCATRVLRTYSRSSVQCTRCLLTQAYNCDEAWQSRMDTPLLKQIEPGLFLQKFQDKIEREKKASALDMDILANVMHKMRPQQLDFVKGLYESFRLCQDALGMYDSTSYAYIRALNGFQETKRLLDMLQDKIKYGIFLDPHTANMLLDSYIENKQYEEAAVIAVDQMLQEDFSHPITRYLSWHACHLYWKEVLSQREPEQPTAPQDDEEEEWVAVPYIINPYYHDHFDIPLFSMKVGKAMMMLGRLDGQHLGRNYELIGCGFYHKFQQGVDLLQKISQSPDMHIAKEALESFQLNFEKFQPEEPNPEKDPGELTINDVRPRFTQEMKTECELQLQECLKSLESSNKIKEEDLGAQLLEIVTTEVPKHEAADIEKQLQLFSSWNEKRQQELDKHLAKLKDQQMRYDIAKKLRELQDKEERLSFFEDEDNIKLAIKNLSKRKTVEVDNLEEVYVNVPGEK